MWVCLWVCVCVCECVWERERERERESVNTSAGKWLYSPLGSAENGLDWKLYPEASVHWTNRQKISFAWGFIKRELVYTAAWLWWDVSEREIRLQSHPQRGRRHTDTSRMRTNTHTFVSLTACALIGQSFSGKWVKLDSTPAASNTKVSHHTLDKSSDGNNGVINKRRY